MATDEICFPCSVGIFHTCPRCQAIVSGSSQGPCCPCSQRRHSERQVATEAAPIQRKWLVDQFQMVRQFVEYCTSEAVELEKRTATGRIATPVLRLHTAGSRPRPQILTA